MRRPPLAPILFTRALLARVLLAATLCLGTHAAATRAAEPTRAGITQEMHDAAANLAKTLGSDATMRHMLDVLKGQIETSITSRNPGANVKKAMDEIVMPELRQHLSGLSNVLADVWASHFNLDELKQLRAFYETSLGRKALQFLPQIVVESQTAGNQWAKDVFRDILEKHGEELKALGITPSR